MRVYCQFTSLCMLKTLQSLQGIIKPEIFSLELKKELAECGIALVFVPHLKGSFLQGATFMDGNKIVVGLTARGKDADKFWFSLFHELAQIILRHVNQLNGTTEDDEKEAYFLFLKNKNSSRNSRR